MIGNRMICQPGPSGQKDGLLLPTERKVAAMMKLGELKVAELPGESEKPKVLHFKSFEIEPFGFEDLQRSNPREPIDLSVKFRNAKLGDQCENVEVTDETYRSDFEIECRIATHSYVLTQGGWFPPGFSTRDNVTYLLDRCAYNDVRAYCRGRNGDVPDKDFIEYLTHPGTRINVLPTIIEGNNRRIPSEFEILQQFEEVMKNLRPILPDAIFQPDGAAAIIAAKNLLADPFLAIDQEERFLKDIAPFLKSPVARRRQAEVVERIRMSADLHGIARGSFVFLAAVSATICPQALNPARDILKIRSNYRDRDIYNALSDLRSLKLLSALIASLPDHTPTFCTADKSLALFWVGLEGRDFKHTGNKMSYSFSLSDRLFPGIDKSLLR